MVFIFKDIVTMMQKKNEEVSIMVTWATHHLFLQYSIGKNKNLIFDPVVGDLSKSWTGNQAASERTM